jgi:hypothetical protein
MANFSLGVMPPEARDGVLTTFVASFFSIEF